MKVVSFGSCSKNATITRDGLLKLRLNRLGMQVLSMPTIRGAGASTITLADLEGVRGSEIFTKNVVSDHFRVASPSFADRMVENFSHERVHPPPFPLQTFLV